MHKIIAMDSSSSLLLSHLAMRVYIAVGVFGIIILDDFVRMFAACVCLWLSLEHYTVVNSVVQSRNTYMK